MSLLVTITTRSTYFVLFALEKEVTRGKIQNMSWRANLYCFSPFLLSNPFWLRPFGVFPEKKITEKD
ncbi:hypothetical protein RJT34_08254 [Clitoria ternatea]|uniref:Uncharacterized protein n=1 Tax=Clitoria ternatea TaxID=43366 RepID=A0AAN9K5K5_CLITE